MSFNTTLSLQLTASAATNIALSQSPGGAGNLTLNGAAVTAGVAILDVARRVGITSGGNDTGRTFTIVGTTYDDRPVTEALAGASGGVAQSVNDFKTVTRVGIDGASAGTVTVGTTGVGSTSPIILDGYVNPSGRTLGCNATGTVNYTIEVATEYLAPQWDTSATPPNWYSATGFTALAADQAGLFTGSYTMMRLTINSGTGGVVVNVNTPYISN